MHCGEEIRFEKDSVLLAMAGIIATRAESAEAAREWPGQSRRLIYPSHFFLRKTRLEPRLILPVQNFVNTIIQMIHSYLLGPLFVTFQAHFAWPETETPVFNGEFSFFGRKKTKILWGGITSKLASQWQCLTWGIYKHAPPVFWRKRRLSYVEKKVAI